MSLVPSTDLNRLKAGVRQFAAGFTPGQKAVTVAALLGAVLVAVIFMTLSGKPTYSVLFSGLQGQDAAKITQQLSTDHVPYQLEDGGSTILVPANDVAQARLTAAATGLPSQGTVGLSLLTKAGLTTSQITQQADYLQAIQGELEQTIDGIAGVQSSQVNVAEPANQTFALQNTAPTGASVLVTMEQGKTLSPGQVQAIVHLVASSVPGLAASNVTVADGNGNLLAGPGVSASASSSSATATYDSSVQAKVASYLTSVFGPDNSDVQVDATLNFDKVKSTIHQLAPPVKGAKTSFCTQTTQTSTTFTGKSPQGGGAAGAITAPTGSGTSGKYTQTKTSKTCETGTETTTTTQAAGSVVRQSVAVLVNKSAVPKGTTLLAIKNGVAAAANLDTARGDVLSFTVAPFSTAAARQAAAAAKAAAAAAGKAKLGGMIRDAVPLLAVAALIVLLWLSARKRRLAPSAMLDTSMFTPYVPAPAELPTSQVPAVHANAPTGLELEHYIDQAAEPVAQVMRGWMNRNLHPEEQRV